LRLAAGLTLIVALSACKTRPYEVVSTQSCATHTRESIPLRNVSPVDDFSTNQARITVSVPLRSCDAVAAVGAALGSDGKMHVDASVWRATGDCETSRNVDRPIVIPPGDFDFVDDTSGNDLGTLLLGGLGQPTGSCSAHPEGSNCTDDCQCQAADGALRCLGFLGDHGLCARQCSDDRDCADATRPRCTTETSVKLVCYAAGDDCCTADSCGAGFACQGCECHPLGPAGGACRCDADCASGLCGDGRCVTPG
jgi:hypothetical protein